MSILTVLSAITAVGKVQNLFKSPTTYAAGAVATGGFTLATYNSEHEMWIGMITALVSGILFAINERAENKD